MRIDVEICTDSDRDVLTGFMHAFCEEDGHPHGVDNEMALRELIDNPLHGRALMIVRDGEPVGYAALCYGYSLEFRGRDGFIDELYVEPGHRGLGIAARALDRIETIARSDGVRALHLEVMDANPGAARLYARHGWRQRPSRMMTKRLTRAGDA